MEFILFYASCFSSECSSSINKKINFLDYRVDFGYKLGKRGIFWGIKVGEDSSLQLSLES